MAASTTGTARVVMHGSWRPWISRGTSVFSARDTLSWRWAMDDVGFTAARNTMGMPEVMPPKMPPWRLVRVFTCVPSI